MKCGDCMQEIGSAASFVWGTVLYNKDGSTHYCDEDEAVPR